jgi:hypothetical protein
MLATETASEDSCVVSIPIWSDCDPHFSGSRRSRNRVSIPIWSDCDKKCNQNATAKNRFNSNMVWLWCREKVCDSLGYFRFNSNMVWLWFWLNQTKCPAFEVSIPIWSDCDDFLKVYNPSEKKSFNSNMVWLWWASKNKETYVNQGFNSNMVWLWLWSRGYLTHTLKSFNSNMVWLWLAADGVLRALERMFQFQYGLIVIKNLPCCMSLCRVSIPIWSDCDCGNWMKCLLSQTCFNSNMVWLWWDLNAVIGNNLMSFNSNMVWLWSFTFLLTISDLYAFQFQYGLIVITRG